MKNAKIYDKSLFQIVENVLKECDSCNLYKKPVPRPVVSLPRATFFNDNVAMDLHHLNENLWYLHFIDEFSRFSTGATIRKKHPNTVIKIFLKQWISIFGTPHSIYSDNGGEFVSKDIIDFCENFNITLKTTPAESPWSNGIF